MKKEITMKNEYEIGKWVWIIKNNLIQHVPIVKKQVIKTFNAEEHRDTEVISYWVASVTSEDRKWVAAETEVKESEMYATKELAIADRTCEK